MPAFRIAITLAVAALAIAPAAAVPRPDPVQAIANALTRQLRGDVVKHSRAELVAAVKSADINGDGVQDYQVELGPLSPAWCGTGGCRYQLWLGRKGAAPIRVFDRQVREMKVETRAGRIVFVFDFHGSQCGGFGSELCPGEFAWSAKRGRMVLLPTPAKHTAVASPIFVPQ